MDGVDLIIPYREESPERGRIFRWVLERWQHYFPSFNVVLGTDNQPFNRATARNNAIRDSTRHTVIIADADTTFGHPKSVRQAIHLLSDKPWVLPYTLYHNLTEQYTDALLETHPSVVLNASSIPSFEHVLDTTVSGILVLPRDALNEVGGYDERFKNWGYEDNAFQMALDTLWGQHCRLDAELFHLWHPMGERFDNPYIHANRALYARYAHAHNNRDLMRQVKE